MHDAAVGPDEELGDTIALAPRSDSGILRQHQDAQYLLSLTTDQLKVELKFWPYVFFENHINL